jgi:transposase-like protein
MDVNGQGFWAIERVTGVNHNTVLNWVKQAALSLPDTPAHEEITEVAQLDELQTFVKAKK